MNERLLIPLALVLIAFGGTLALNSWLPISFDSGAGSARLPAQRALADRRPGLTPSVGSPLRVLAAAKPAFATPAIMPDGATVDLVENDRSDDQLSVPLEPWSSAD